MKRRLLVALLAGSLLAPALQSSPAAAHGLCSPSDYWNPGTGGFVIRGIWTCTENHYKYKIRSFVQTRLGPGGGWYNVKGTTVTNTKYQTSFISDNRGSTFCVPGANPFQEYRVAIDYVHVWNQNLKHILEHETEGWQGPNHTFNCVP